MNTLTQLFDWLLAASLRASLLTLATLLIQAALHRHLSARMRYALWLPALIVLLMPVLPQSRWSIEHVFQTPPPPAQLISAPISPAMDSTPVVFEAVAPMPELINWQRILLLTWLFISAGILTLGGISFLLTLHRFKQARHAASDELLAMLAQIAAEVRLRHVPRVLIASSVSSPAVTGLIRPTLLLPADFDREFTPAEARLVLKHELMHLKRGDLPLNALMCVLMALHWFNPLLWIAFFKIRADREAACDAQVLRDATKDHRAEYGHALLKVETAFCPRGFSLGFVGIFQRGSALRSRIQSIAAHRAPHPSMKALMTLSIVLMTFFGVTRAQQPKPGEDVQLVAIEIKIVKFNKATAWNFGGRLTDKDINAFSPPALLSPEELAVQLREVIRNDSTNVISYPRMVTVSGHELMVKSVVNQPFKGKEGKVEELPIGLVCKFTPTLNGESVKLDMDITDANLIDPATGAAVSEFKGDYPTVRTRTYKASHEGPDGQSWVIASWDDGKPQSKRPVLYIITPHVIDPKQGGLPAAAPSDFAVGKSAFRPRDSMVITSMTRSAEMLTVGVDYELGSKDIAIAALYITSTTDDKSSAFDERQQAVVKRGRGSFVLHLPTPSQGLPHVTFYDIDSHKPFGGIYFGTEAEAAKSSALDLSYMTASAEAKAGASTDFIKTKLNEIIIPSVHFQGATVEEAIEYLRVKSRELSPGPKAPGVSIIYRQGDPPSKAAITMDLKDVPLGEALRYVVELANLKMSVQPYAIIVGQNVPSTGAESPAPKSAVETPSEKIIIPSIEFRDATLTECIDFIRIKARDLDPDKKGVNIIIKPGGDASARITLSLKDVPLSEALRYCAELANHKLTSNAQSFSLTPVSAEAPATKDQASRPDAPPPASTAEAKAAELRKARPQQYDFAKANLGDVMRFLATDAGINFFSLPPEDNPINQKLITFSIRSSPFEVLETLCRANGLVLVLDQEVWCIRAADDTALVSKEYALPQTQASIETILKDLSTVINGGETKPAADKSQPSVTFKKEQNSISIKATHLQHTWASAYFQGLSSSAQSGKTK